MNRRRIWDIIAFLAMMVVLLCICGIYAQAYKKTVQVEQMVEQVSYEDPRESEKIEAALNWHYIEDVTLTAYCPCAECCGKSDGITATGAQAQQGVTIAVDPDVIPLGAWVEIDGHMFHAEDVGGGVNGNHIDVYYDSHEMVSAFGVKTRDVRWYE